MNYLKQVLALNRLQLIQPLSSGQFILWHALMDINNQVSWTDGFEVANRRLEAFTCLSRSGVQKARNALKQKGLIEFKTNGTQSTTYSIKKLYDEDRVPVSTQVSNQASTQVSNQVSNQVSTQIGTQIGNQMSTQIGGTLIKQNINQTKRKDQTIVGQPPDDLSVPEKKATAQPPAPAAKRQPAVEPGKTSDKWRRERQGVVDYLNRKANKHYKASSAKAVASINARLNEGYTGADFKNVIDKKVQQWLRTEQEIYLRPETLFGTKFDGYLNEPDTLPTRGANRRVVRREILPDWANETAQPPKPGETDVPEGWTSPLPTIQRKTRRNGDV